MFVFVRCWCGFAVVFVARRVVDSRVMRLSGELERFLREEPESEGFLVELSLGPTSVNVVYRALRGLHGCLKRNHRNGVLE